MMKPRPRKLNLFLIFVMLLLAYPFCSLSAQTKGEEEMAALEEVLGTNVNFNGDTLALVARLDSVKLLAEAERSVPLKWAYYMLMADGFSIAFDRVNPITDRYYRLARELVSSPKTRELLQVGLMRQGYYHFIYRDVSRAIPFFLRADDMDQEVDLGKVPNITENYGFAAGFYSFIGNQAKAREYLQKALPFAKNPSRKRIDMLNSLGVYSVKDSLLEEGNRYFKLAIAAAKSAQDSVWMGIITGNIADIERKKGNRELAIKLLLKNVSLSKRFGETQDAMRANLELANMYIAKGEPEKARGHVLDAQADMAQKPYYLPYMMESKRLLSKVAGIQKNPQEELKYIKEYLQLKDSIDEKLDFEKLQKVAYQWEVQRYAQGLENEGLRRRKDLQTYIYVFIFIVLGLALILLLVNRSKNRIMYMNAALERDQLELSYEKQLVDHELEALNRSLQEFTDTVKQNDLTIQRFRNEVIQNLDHFPDRQELFNDSLNKMLEKQVMTEERWVKFNDIFERVYPGYLAKEKEAYPRLTDYDFRLISLMKLGLSNRSMADLLGITLEGVKKAKQRLKKKMERQ
ncbi:tetratricopeptide repeat protein [Sphingobacterium sp. NPDC055346]